MKYELCEYLYGLPEDHLARILSWAYNQGNALPDRSADEESTLKFVKTAIYKLEKPA